MLVSAKKMEKWVNERKFNPGLEEYEPELEEYEPEDLDKKLQMVCAEVRTKQRSIFFNIILLRIF